MSGFRGHGVRIPRGALLAWGPLLCLMGSKKGVALEVSRLALTDPDVPDWGGGL